MIKTVQQPTCSPPAGVGMRLWQYQRERFPLAKHGMLVAAFSFCAVCLSALLRGATVWPAWQTALVAFGVVLLAFLQLRIADEFKDAATDAQYRPERPVPRGLVTLTELRWVGIVAMVIQVGLALWLHSLLLVPLVVLWGYMALMRIEFGVPNWLHRHPLVYLVSHMVIVPLIDFSATTADWLPHGHTAAKTLTWFLAVSFFNGIVIEIGRKTWAPAQERAGVESYSSTWGIRRAVGSWLGALAAAYCCALAVAAAIDFFWPVFGLLTAGLAGLSGLGWRFVKQPTAGGAAALETYSGLWVAGLYLILGIAPMGLQAMGGTPWF